MSREFKTTWSSPYDFTKICFEHHVKTYRAGRKCRICKFPLSVYNKYDICGGCHTANMDKLIDEIMREAEDKQVKIREEKRQRVVKKYWADGHERKLTRRKGIDNG